MLLEKDKEMEGIDNQIWAIEHNAFVELKKASSNFLDKVIKIASLPLAVLQKSNIENWKVSASEISAEDTSSQTRKNGKNYNIRVIPVEGTLFKKSSRYDEYFGITSTEKIATYINEANGDDTVDAIVLSFNTNGGMVEGTETLANLIASSKKPVVAYVDSKAHSAGYWLASQTSKIIMAESTAMVGSIGTMTTHVNYAGYYQLFGEQVTHITSDGSEDKNFPNDTMALDEAGIAAIKAILNPINAIFLAAVKKGRKEISADALTGKIFSAADAILLGMADSIGTIEIAAKEAAKLVSTLNTNKAMAEKVEGQGLLWFTNKLDEQGKLLAELQEKLNAVQNENASIKAELAKEKVESAKVVALQSDVETLKASLADAPQKVEATKVFKKADVFGNEITEKISFKTSFEDALIGKSSNNNIQAMLDLAKKI